MDFEPNKMMGYLEKKIKMLGWRRYWFVLDGRLLTYYKSQLEYKSLSACCGSINLGIAINVSPIYPSNTKGFPLQIVTRTQVYFLRAGEKSELTQWLIAIQEGVEIPPRISSVSSITVTVPLRSLKPRAKSSASGAGAGTGTASGEETIDDECFLAPLRTAVSALSLSQSQWSVNVSTEDLRNFTIAECTGAGLKTPREKSLLKKYYSLASLNFPFQNNKNYINHNYYNTNNNNNYYNKGKDNSLKNKSKKENRIDPYVDNNINNTLWKSTSTINEMQEIIPRNKTNFSKPRNTASMLVLGSGNGSGSSSPGQTSQGHTLSSNSFRGGGEAGSRKSTLSIPTFPKTGTGTLERIVTWDPTDRQPRAKNPENNIYTNSEASVGQGQGSRITNTPLTSTTATITTLHHEYDEIADLKKESSDSLNPSEGIYENIDADKDSDPWEKLPQRTHKNSVSRSMGRNSLVSIDEAAESRESRPNSGTISISNSNSNSLTKPRNPIQTVPSPSTSSSSSLSIQNPIPNQTVVPAPSPSQPEKIARDRDLEDPENSSKRSGSGDGKSKKRSKKTNITAKKSFSGFFHKIFHKDKKKGQTQNQSDEENKEHMVITGPIDLRKVRGEQKLSAALNSRKTFTFTPDMGVPYTQSQQSPIMAASSGIKNQSQSQGHSQSKPINITSMKGVKPAVGSCSKSNASSNEDLLEELNKRFGDKKRNSGIEGTLNNPPSHERILQTRNSHDRQSDSDSRPQILRKKSDNCLPAYTVKHPHLSMTHALNKRPSLDIPVRAVSTGESEDFLRKLAHFNRLSASLDPNFVAACSTLRNSFINNFGIPRSNSLRVRSSLLEEPPVLPPKRRQIPQKSVYDTPKNNAPVMHDSHNSADPLMDDANSYSGTMRELTKKYSAPDISFNSPELRLFNDDPEDIKGKAVLIRKSFDVRLQPSYASQSIDPNANLESKLQLSFNPPPRPPKSDKTPTATPEAASDMVFIPAVLLNSNKAANVGSAGQSVSKNDSSMYSSVNKLKDKKAVETTVQSDGMEIDIKRAEIPELKSTEQKTKEIESLANIEIKSTETTNSTKIKIISNDLKRDVKLTQEVENQNKGQTVDFGYIVLPGKLPTASDAASVTITRIPIVDAIPFDAKTETADEMEIADELHTISDYEYQNIPVASVDEIVEVIEQSHTNEIKIIQPPVPVRHHAELLRLDLPKMQSLTLNSNCNLNIDNNNDSNLINLPKTPIHTPVPSPSWSHKSVDIDSLEVLSDISSGSTTNGSSNRNVTPQSLSLPVSPNESPVPVPVPVPVTTAQLEVVISQKEGDTMIQIGETLITENTTIEEIQRLEASPVNGNKEEIRERADPVDLADLSGQNTSDIQAKATVDEVPPVLNVCGESSSVTVAQAPWKVNYATVNAVAWETVEETEEELNELYDEFPADINFSFPATATPIAAGAMPGMDTVHTEDKNDVQSDKYNSNIRHSGIEQLQAFLFSEENQTQNQDLPSDWSGQMLPNSNLSIGGGSVSSSGSGSSISSASSRGAAVNRLGHSSAIEQLKKIFED